MIHARQKRAQIVIRLKAYEIVLAQVTDQFGIVRQYPQHLAMRKGNVQKKSDRTAKLRLPQITAEWNELVIVDPDRVIRLEQLHELPRELRVFGLIGVILRFLVYEAIREIVKYRPQRAVAKAVVERIEIRSFQIDRGKPYVAPDQYFGLGARLFRRLAAPAEPNPVCFFESGQHPDGLFFWCFFLAWV